MTLFTLGPVFLPKGVSTYDSLTPINVYEIVYGGSLFFPRELDERAVDVKGEPNGLEG